MDDIPRRETDPVEELWTALKDAASAHFLTALNSTDREARLRSQGWIDRHRALIVSGGYTFEMISRATAGEVGEAWDRRLRLATGVVLGRPTSPPAGDR